jgi:hypothetical protein
MDRNDAVGMEQNGLGHGGSPTGTIPSVDLHAHAEAVEVNLISGRHCDVLRNFGRAVIVACGQSGKATPQEQRHRTDNSFVGATRRQYKRSQPAKSRHFIYRFHFVWFFHRNLFHSSFVYAPLTGAKVITAAPSHVTQASR